MVALVGPFLVRLCGFVHLPPSLLALPYDDEGLDESAFCVCRVVLWLSSPLFRCLIPCGSECPYESSLLCFLQLFPVFFWLALSFRYDILHDLRLVLFRCCLELLSLLL